MKIQRTWGDFPVHYINLIEQVCSGSPFEDEMMPASKPPWEISRSMLVKAEEEIDPRYGRRPQERSVEDYIRFGVINLDKTSGPSSHETAAWVKRLMKIAQAGHGGTLEASVDEARDILE